MPGDVVVVMSNGGFGGIHGKLLQALVMKVRLAGDTLLLVEFEPADRSRGQRARRSRWRTRCGSVGVDGVRDVVPGYCSLGVHFDPLQTDLAALERAIGPSARGDRRSPAPAAVARRSRFRCATAEPDGPDLDAVARFAGCSAARGDRAARGHSYRVYMLGFVPGFAYLGRVHPSIAAPRHRVPRERVPAGSVGIAGEQTGVYPIETPGWLAADRPHGDGDVRSASRSPASLLAPATSVRFVPA